MLSANLSGYPTRPDLQAIREYMRTGGENPFTKGVKRAVQDQIAAKVDIITDGQVREIVPLIALSVPGITTNDEIRIENRLGLPRAPVVVEDFSIAAKECGNRAQVKASLPGPISFASSCLVDPKSSYRSNKDPDLLFDVASVLRYEIDALRGANARFIQVTENSDEIHDWDLFLELLQILFRRVKTPVCHLVGDISKAFIRLLEGAATAISFDLVAFPQNRNITSYKEAFLVHEKFVSLGCVDASTSKQESIDVIERRANPFVEAFGYEAVWISPSDTLARLSSSSAFSKLKQLELVKRRYASKAL
ncbi:MAG: hypothetical protein ACXV46_03295 [Halobacteriota archaeon]